MSQPAKSTAASAITNHATTRSGIASGSPSVTLAMPYQTAAAAMPSNSAAAHSITQRRKSRVEDEVATADQASARRVSMVPVSHVAPKISSIGIHSPNGLANMP